MSLYFQPEIITNILSRLPVKPLARFKCVSKSWLYLISSPEFIKIHLHQSLQSHTNLSLIARSPLAMYTAELDHLQSNPVKLCHPFETDNDNRGRVFIIGSCNGLLALYNSQGDVALWNPTTGESIMLESPHLSVEFLNVLMFGGVEVVYSFGYDCLSDDYKLVRIVHFLGATKSETMVYSLKNKCWKHIKDFPYFFRGQPQCGSLAGNSLHWLVYKDKDSDTNPFVVRLDLGSEDYSQVPLPTFDGSCFVMSVQVMEGRLCLLCNYMSNCIDIWVMEEYGDKESWIKLVKVTGDFIGDFEFVKPLAYSSDGNEVLLKHDLNKFWWFDLKRKQAKSVTISGLPEIIESCICVGSLVSLNGGKRFGKIAESKFKEEPAGKDNKKKKIKKKRDDFLSTGFKLVL